MEKLLLIVSLFLNLTLFAQNPITQETNYRLTNENEWRKVSVLDNIYQNGSLTKTIQRTYNNVLADWFISDEEWFDAEGRSIRRMTRSFLSRDNGFFFRDNQSTYSDTGQLILSLNYSKRGNNQPLVLDSRTEIEYAQCSYLEKVYVPENGNEENLVFDNSVLSFFDDECRFVRFVFSTQADESIEDLQQKVRVRYESLPNNERLRIVEELTCPTNTQNCDQWDVKERLTFDDMGRDIRREIGSINDFVRTITDISYESDQKIFDIKTFINLDGFSQRLTGIEQEILSLDEERVFYRRRLEPFVEEVWNYEYAADGLIEQEVYLRSSKSAEGVSDFRDTTNYSYQFYCDGLTSEVVVQNQNNQTRTTYNYLYPTDCGTAVTELNEFSIFPNPANNTINISNNAFIDNTYDLAIYDSMGRFVRTIQNSRGITQSIDVADLSNGIYQLSIRQTEGNITELFIIQR